jgi:hypothetical protein
LDLDGTHGTYLHDNPCLLPFSDIGRFLDSPGRFFAVNEIKALLARILESYDVKFEEGEGVPREFRIGAFRGPGDTTLLFKKRQK